MTTLNTTLEEGELEKTICVAENSWYEECEADSMTNHPTCMSSKSSSPDSANVSSSSADREILVTFLDASNEAKFDRLLKEEKIRTTFKRCLSPKSATESSGAKRSSNALDDGGRDRDESPDSSERSSSSNGKRVREYETDESILDRRQKQIDFGKNTLGYDSYLKQVPREKRTADHPWTPQKNLKYSRRAFDGLVKIWRKKLHTYDPSSLKANTGNKKTV